MKPAVDRDMSLNILAQTILQNCKNKTYITGMFFCKIKAHQILYNEIKTARAVFSKN